MTFHAIVVAAGSGSRAGGAKQWRRVGGRPVVRWSVEALLDAGAIAVAVVIPPGAQTEAEEALADLPRWFAVEGGTERAASVRNGLDALAAHTPEHVLVHDAARPFLNRAVVHALVAALIDVEAALPALAVPDSLKQAGGDQIVTATVPREGLYRAQTPQAFRYAKLVAAHAAWDGSEAPTDDTVVIERAGGKVRLIPGDPRLMKLTYPEDFDMAEALAGGMRDLRIGQGLDAHRFGPGDTVWLCGVAIPHTCALVGHSDADAGLHAITDAVLGAIGQGDIGDHFPPTDPKWRGAASDLFLRHAVQLVKARGGRLVNVDVTLVCERPKIKPHRDAMRARLAEILALPVDAVSVKATTMEQMGFTGREEGLAAQAVATVELPRG